MSTINLWETVNLCQGFLLKDKELIIVEKGLIMDWVEKVLDRFKTLLVESYNNLQGRRMQLCPE